MLINVLPMVQLVGSVPQHFPIACSLTNSTPYNMDRQIVPSRSLHGYDRISDHLSKTAVQTLGGHKPGALVAMYPPMLPVIVIGLRAG